MLMLKMIDPYTIVMGILEIVAGLILMGLDPGNNVSIMIFSVSIGFAYLLGVGLLTKGIFSIIVGVFDID